MDNRIIVEKLRTHARQLEREQDNLYRIKAYRRAAEAIERLPMRVSELVEAQGVQGLRRLPGVGDHLSFAIERLIATGDFHNLGEMRPAPPRDEDVLALSGVGPHLAEMLWEELGIRTIAELEEAERTHRLDQLQLSERRRWKLCDALRRHRDEDQQVQPVRGEPSVAVLLNMDRDYRRLAAKNQLPTIAPDKFNPFNESCLPLHFARRRGWKLRALYCNTALAHRLGRTHDWVVIYFSNDAHRGQRTIITETRGELRGRRVVRGREAECRRWLDAHAKHP